MNAETAGHAGTPQLKQFHMVNIKQNLTLQQKRFRAAVDYSSCICKSGGEAAQGSLPAQRPHSDQVISLSPRDGVVERAPGPGLKRQASSNKLREIQASSGKHQAPSTKVQAPSRKRQAPGPWILEKVSR